MSDLSDHFDRGGFCSCCGTLWPCAALRRAFLAQRAAVVVSAAREPLESLDDPPEQQSAEPD